MASDQSIGITLTANSTGVEQALGKLATGLDRTIDKLNKLEKASKGATKATEDGLASGAAQALKFAGAITGIGGAIGGMLAIVNQIKREYDNMVSRQKEAAGTQVGFETQLAEAVRNAAGLLTGEEVKKETLRIAEKTAADPAAVASALSSTLSAVGPTNKAEAQQAFAATEAAMKFAPEMSGPDIAALAGTAVDIAKRTGATPEQAIGFMQNIGGVARVPSLQNLSGNVAPAVMSVKQFGGSMEDAGGLVSALTQGMADTEGRISGTAAIGLAEQLRERLPKLADTRSRIDAIASNPALYKAFFQGGVFGGKKFEPASFEKKALASVEQVLTEGSMLNQAFKGGAAKIGDVQGAGQKTYDDLLKEVNSVTFTGRAQRVFSSATKGQQILDAKGGITSVNREGLQAYLKAMGESDFSQRLDAMLFEGKTLTGSNAMDVTSGALRARAAALRSPVKIGDTDLMGRRKIGVGITEDESKNATAFEKLADKIDVLSKEMKANTEATSANTKASPSPVQRPSRVPSAALSRRN